MALHEGLLVVDSDLRRRVAAVEALVHAGYDTVGVGDVARLADMRRAPALVIVRADTREQLEDVVAGLQQNDQLREAGLIVVSDVDSDIKPVDAFALGAVDHVDEDVDVGELTARVQARLYPSRPSIRIPASAQPLSQPPTIPPISRRRTALLLELTRKLSSALELHDILDLVVRRIAEVIDVDRVSIVLGEGDAGYVICSSDDDAVRDLPIDLGRYPELARVFATGEPLIIEDADRHPLLEVQPVPLRFRSLVLFPITVEDETVGALFLRYGRRHRPNDEERFVLSAVANASGIALRNASLVGQLRARARATGEQQIKAVRQYADFFESCADGIVVLDFDGRVLFCNPAAAAITSHESNDLLGANFAKLLRDDARTRFTELMDGFRDGDFPTNVDLAIGSDDGPRILNVSFSSVLRRHDGVIATLRDVTEERSLGRELTKTKEFLQRVIDSSVDAIISADMRGEVLLFNPAAEQTYGYRAEEVVGKLHVSKLYAPGRAREIMRRIRSAEHGGSGVLQGFDTEVRAKDGSDVPVTLSAALIVHRDRPIGSVGVFRDLRAKLHIEERLATAQRELADKEQKAFIAELAGATAHELNQPLTAVMGYAGMLARQIEAESNMRHAADAIVRETERMADIVRKIGKLTKYESKAYVGDTKIIDIERSMDNEPPVTGM